MATTPVPVALVPKFASTWQHYKGGTYTVLAVATHTGTKERMVVYMSTDPELAEIYTRPLAEWHAEVGATNRWHGQPRFTAVPQVP